MDNIYNQKRFKGKQINQINRFNLIYNNNHNNNPNNHLYINNNNNNNNKLNNLLNKIKKFNQVKFNNL